MPSSASDSLIHSDIQALVQAIQTLTDCFQKQPQNGVIENTSQNTGNNLNWQSLRRESENIQLITTLNKQQNVEKVSKNQINAFILQSSLLYLSTPFLHASWTFRESTDIIISMIKPFMVVKYRTINSTSQLNFHSRLSFLTKVIPPQTALITYIAYHNNTTIIL